METVALERLGDLWRRSTEEGCENSGLGSSLGSSGITAIASTIRLPHATIPGGGQLMYDRLASMR
jgi:hypothetical protein